MAPDAPNLLLGRNLNDVSNVPNCVSPFCPLDSLRVRTVSVAPQEANAGQEIHGGPGLHANDPGDPIFGHPLERDCSRNHAGSGNSTLSGTRSLGYGFRGGIRCVNSITQRYEPYAVRFGRKQRTRPKQPPHAAAHALWLRFIRTPKRLDAEYENALIASRRASQSSRDFEDGRAVAAALLACDRSIMPATRFNIKWGVAPASGSRLLRLARLRSNRLG